MIRTRRVRPEDADALAALVQRNREFLKPWEPQRDEAHYTVAGQRAGIDAALEQYERGLMVPQVILDDVDIVGRVFLTGIAYGAARSCDITYWVSGEANGRGIATDAVGQLRQYAFDVMGLHRVQAASLVHNVASQKVLERNGFRRFGLAPSYLHIAGRWQDHVLFQALAP
ncbi:GNAT family N-acetyltransferase [Nigerium massiliense]|uniref:GNAT family N-acetyltransferase n=1 Tax=Nigerium massiliense TaxID=1522317 RepID=UPI0005918290|nr:GNAT family protein [Nigerium massiliense]